MKKFLLFAAAAIVAVSANAQLASKKSFQRKSHHQTKVVPAAQQKLSKKDIVMPQVHSGKLSLDLFSPDVKLNKKARGYEAMKAGKSKINVAARRAGTILASYDGYGTDKDDGAVKWTMTVDQANSTITDVIPSIAQDGGISVEYTVSGSTITIPAQCIAQNEYQGEMDYIFLFGANDESGAITLTVNDDNSISTEDDILYGGFSANAFDPTFETYTGYYEYVTKISYLAPGQVKAPVVFYEPDGVYLHVCTSPTWYSYSTATFMYLPVDAETAFLNNTQDNTDTWSWSMDKLKVNDAQTAYEVDQTLTSSSAEFSVITAPNDIYYQPVLKGSFNGAQSEPYQWSVRRGKETGYIFAGGTMDDEFSDGSMAQIAKCDPANRVSSFAAMGTPTVNSNGYNISDLILYQGKPAKPLYFEGVSLWVGSFTKEANFNLKCKIVKVTRDPSTLRITLGDVIAEADVDQTDIVLDEDDPTDVWAQLNWNEFYVEDEEGMSETINYIQIEDEFAIMFEGWNNGSFTAVPIIEYSGDMVNTESTTSLYLHQEGDEAVYGFFNKLSHPYVSYKGAAYGYLYTEDSKDITLPDDGTPVSIKVHPMFYAPNQDTGEPETAIWLADDSDDIPAWLNVEYTNPVSADDLSFDLMFSLVPSNEAAPARRTADNTVTLKFEQWGGKLEVTVTRNESGSGGGDGISAVVTKIDNNAPAYNVAGQRVNSGFKGLIVKDGKKFMNK